MIRCVDDNSDLMTWGTCGPKTPLMTEVSGWRGADGHCNHCCGLPSLFCWNCFEEDVPVVSFLIRQPAYEIRTRPLPLLTMTVVEMLNQEHDNGIIFQRV